MDYYLIKGQFHVVGYSPDGDSIMFEADSPKMWDRIESQMVDRFKEKLEEGEGAVQLRLQGIDALETHYSSPPIAPPKEYRSVSYAKAEKPKMLKLRQPVEFGQIATEKLLKFLGTTSVTWASNFGRKWIREISVSEKGEETAFNKKNEGGLDGFIVTNDIEKNGRPISWIFPGNTRLRDGSKLDTSDLLEIIKDSLNYNLLASGLVYPYFFMTLASPLRQALIYGVLNAQRQKMGIWKLDKTQEGMSVKRLSQLTDELLLWPYLFRRIVKNQYKRNMEGYWEAASKKKSYVADEEALHLETFFSDTNPYVFMVKESDFVRLDQVVSISKDKFKLNTHPGNIVFLSY
ncbi:MAG: hypothetical protein MRZ79_24055 [Bacteroidia bacterium]|nr:hypothetical protein [Bacteroidia bacterium]